MKIIISLRILCTKIINLKNISYLKSNTIDPYNNLSYHNYNYRPCYKVSQTGPDGGFLKYEVLHCSKKHCKIDQDSEKA